MHFQQFYLGCLAQASYVIGDGGECVVVDPRRDVDEYLDYAASHDLTIRYVLETHLHADFVSGHGELAARTGAQIAIGAKSGATFPHMPVHDGDRIAVGGIELVALETPGHTPEGISWLVVEGGRTTKVLTGDTLFIGDVGRPDLAGGRGYTPAAMASMLYDSLHQKLLALDDEVEVWPAHGAGSACGRNISKETSSTIGLQRRTNYALHPMSREDFVAMMTADLAEPPPYFVRDAEINRSGAPHVGSTPSAPLDARAAAELLSAGAVALDVRDPSEFSRGHLPGSVNIGLSGQFASWAGTLMPFDSPIVLIADDEEHSREAVMRLARVGMENVAGWLSEGVAGWSRSGGSWDSLAQISPAELHAAAGTYRVLDVRAQGEYVAGHVPGASNIPLQQLPRRIAEAGDGPLAVICAGGYRSSAAASLLARSGYKGELVNVTGGTSAWVREGLPVETEP